MAVILAIGTEVVRAVAVLRIKYAVLVLLVRPTNTNAAVQAVFRTTPAGHTQVVIVVARVLLNTNAAVQAVSSTPAEHTQVVIVMVRVL